MGPNDTRRVAAGIAAAALSFTMLTAVPAAHAATEKTTTFFVTGYSWWDNTPPGSSRISQPVIHKTAGGAGTYSDPITLAVGHTITADGEDVLDYPPGTRMYIPNLRRYVIVEDTCGDGPNPQDRACHIGHDTRRGWVPWIDVYVDGKDASKDKSDACMNKIMGVTRVVMDPAPDYIVAPGPISDGKCTEYGRTPTKVRPVSSPAASDQVSTPAPAATPGPNSSRGTGENWFSRLRDWWRSITSG